MQRVIWIIAAIAFFAWSLLAWLGNAMLGWLAGFVAGNADQLTAVGAPAGWLSWVAALADSVGGALIVVVWLFGGAVIAVAAFVIARLVQWQAAPRKPGHYRILPPGRRL
jgi:hypothetical protein